jgi:hypothetical protein
MGTRARFGWIAVGLVAAVMAFLVGWTTHDVMAGDWASVLHNFEAWTGDAGKIALGASIAAVAGLVVGWMNRNEARSDRAEAATAREEARADARQARVFDRKADLYSNLWLECDKHKRQVEAQVAWRRDWRNGKKGKDPGIGSSEPARLAYLALTLLTTIDVSEAAQRLYDATTLLGGHHAYVAKEGHPMPAPDEDLWLSDFNAWNQAAADFENAANADLQGEPSHESAPTTPVLP